MIQYYRSTPYRPQIETDTEAHQHGDWIRVDAPDENDISMLVSLGLDGDVLSDALDPHEVPRIETEDDWTYFIMRLPDTDDGFNDFTTPILFAVGRKYICTVSRDNLSRLWQPFIDKTDVPTSDRANFFFAMIDEIANSYERRVATINRQMRAVTSNVQQLRPSDISTLVQYERKLNDYLDALIPSNTSLEQIRAGKYLKLDEDDRDEVESLSVSLEQVIARCKSLLRTITNVRDSYRAVMDTKLNETMRVLTVATLAITIPTMLAGLYGMNVDLPGSEWTGMFGLVVVISVLAAGVLVYYFMRQR